MASVMMVQAICRGVLNRASSLIRAEHDKAIYVHCMNHRLKLCVADTRQLPLVRNMMDIV